MKTIGTRAQVWHGTCKKTSGGLVKSDLMMNKHGRIVSKAKHATAKKEKRLLKYGFGTQKGKFGAVKMGSRKNMKRSKKMRGGSDGPITPANINDSYLLGIDGQGVTNYGNDSNSVQFAAGMAGGRRRKMRHMKGGYNLYQLNPADVSSTDITGFGASSNSNMMGNGIDGQGATNYGMDSNDVQFAAGMAGGRRRKRGGMKYMGRALSGGYSSMQMGSNLGTTAA